MEPSGGGEGAGGLWGKISIGFFKRLFRSKDKEMVDTYIKSKDASVMVWAFSWGTGRTDLYIIDRDFEGKKSMGYSANSCIEVLDAELAGHYRHSLVFMQDNASIHTYYTKGEGLVQRTNR